jgi:hypothetical protein
MPRPRLARMRLLRDRNKDRCSRSCVSAGPLRGRPPPRTDGVRTPRPISAACGSRLSRVDPQRRDRSVGGGVQGAGSAGALVAIHPDDHHRVLRFIGQPEMPWSRGRHADFKLWRTISPLPRQAAAVTLTAQQTPSKATRRQHVHQEPRRPVSDRNGSHGPISWILESHWAELAFVLWAIVRNPQHPQIIDGSWLPQHWAQWAGPGYPPPQVANFR